MKQTSDILRELRTRFPDADIREQTTRDGIPTAWVAAGRVHDLLRYLKEEANRPYRMLYDLTAVDERERKHPPAVRHDGQALRAGPASTQGETSPAGGPGALAVRSAQAEAAPRTASADSIGEAGTRAAERTGHQNESLAGGAEPSAGFTVIYHLLSFDRNEDLRLKAPLPAERPAVGTVSDLWPAANWYEREVWDMFGIGIEGHPHLARILMPPWWEGHPLRKEHPARATEMAPFRMPGREQAAMEDAMRFEPEAWGMKRQGGDFDFMFLNVGPHHPGTHGVLRVALQLDGQRIVDLACDIGFHHRGAEKMGERQSWHTYIPYTDRVDYLGGVMNNFPYVMAVERLAGIEVPDRAKVIRILLAELFRIINHLVYYGIFSQDVGQMSPVFYMFTDRERAFEIVEAITGGRMHPSWFRIGGVAQDLPEGWEGLVRDFLDYMPRRLKEYDGAVLRNAIFKARTQGIGQFTTAEAVEWGATGPMLRATGLPWDWRRQRPYGGYEQFEFDIPVGRRGDAYDRAVVHVEEMRQSLRIIGQCLDHMPAGEVKSRHPLTTPPLKERTLRDIETLIAHFLNVTWGPVIPAGEASCAVEGTKGLNSYYLVSDGNVEAYRVRIRTPSFPHLQMLPMMTRGLTVPDLIANLGSIDYVLSDVDR